MAASASISPYQVYNCYRFGLASVLWMLVYSGQQPDFFGSFLPSAFITTLTIYWISTLVFLYLAEFKDAQDTTLIFFTFLCDIVAWGFLLHSSGGVTTGFGLVFVTICASAALLLPQQLALFITAVSALGLIGQELWMQQLMPHRSTAFSQVGGHGLLLFISTWLILWLKKRIQKTESMVASFSQMNEAIITQMDIGVIVVDEEKKIVHVNQAAEKLLNFRAEGNTTIEQLPSVIYKAFHQGKSYFPEHNIRFQHLPLSPYTLSLIFDTKMEAKRAQQMRLAALGQLASNIAHEIRNPLSAIVQATDHLKAESGDQAHLLEIIDRQSVRMNQIIETVLSLSKQAQPDARWFQLSDCLSRIALPKENFVLRSINTTTLVNSDFSMLEQILTVLLDNAARFGTAATVSVTQSPQEGILIDITDNGPGILPEDIPSIYDPFFTKNPYGTGLGLFLAQRLCDALGAELYYIDDAEGAHFRLCLGPKMEIKDA